MTEGRRMTEGVTGRAVAASPPAWRFPRMAIPLLFLAVALAAVDGASLRKESPAKAMAPMAVPTPAHPDGSPPVTPSEPTSSGAQASHPPPLAQGRKSLKQRKAAGKKRSPNHALLTKFGLSRWEGEEARMGAAYTAGSWRDSIDAGEEDHSQYPRIPVKVKKGGGGKRRSSEEGESDMYYVRLPPIHQYYSPFLHGHPDAEKETAARYGATNRKHHRHEAEEAAVAASARADDAAPLDGHSPVINIRPLPASPPFDHDASATTHHSQHRHQAVRRLPLSFRTNGKPGPVYHWNLPVLRGEEEGKRGWKKVYGTKSGATQSTHAAAQNPHPKDGKPATPPSAADPTTATTTAEFPYIESDVFHVVKTVRGRVHPMAVPPQRPRVPGGHHRKPYHRKPLSSQPATAFPVTSYYSRKGSKGEAASAGSRDHQHQHTAAQKSFFQGNGKPHGFYVINGSKKYYHRLLP